MSGGFFRGTSADQDTRFSNKAAKLLKSQKFPAELDQLVDMTKVKMDVIRPWIANRATEFLGFEDEVLINFIYGLLDGKEVDGKQIQIQLTGFMEKNTGKFMKELWGLLISAQKNASGIPQQFLDAKAEETRKKKAETDRINYEVQKKKEQEEREAEQERQKKINADLEAAKIAGSAAVSSKPSSGKASFHSHLDEGVAEKRSTRSGGKNGDARLSNAGDRSPLSHRSVPSFSRSRSQSYSVSKSPSRSPRPTKRHRSRSISRSPRHRRRSTSLGRRARSPIYTPPRRKRSPLYARSPRRRRSPSPPRRRSLSPRRRRTPSPKRRRSPVPRSPRPHRRSPVRSPRRRQMDSQSPPPRRKSRSRSPQYRSHRSMSRECNYRFNGLDSRRYRDRYPDHRPRAKQSPEGIPLDREEVEYERRARAGGGRAALELSPHHRHLPIPVRSPQRDLKIYTGKGRIVSDLSPPHRILPNPSHSPPCKMRVDDERRRLSPYQSQTVAIRERVSRRESPELRRKQEPNMRIIEKDDPRVDLYKRDVKEYGPRKVDIEQYSSDDLPVTRSGENRGRHETSEPRRKEYQAHGSDNVDRNLDHPQRRAIQVPYASEGVEYGPGRLDHGQSSLDNLPVNRSGVNHCVEYDDEEDLVGRRRSLSRDSYASDEMRHPAFKGSVDDDKVHKVDVGRKPKPKLEPVKQMIGYDSDADENDVYRRKHSDKRKSKREETGDMTLEEDGDESMSPRTSEERREAKRRRKEEKRIRKEEKRRRREERHRRKEERRASRAKAKAVANATPPERDYSAAGESDDNCHGKDLSHKSGDEEMEDEQQRLEIELRRKALESLRAKKAISH
eukprot:Gb_33063 [translate_table: standard]